MRSRSISMWMFVSLLYCSQSLTPYSTNFTMKTNKYYSENESIPYAQFYPIGQLSAGQQVNLQVLQISSNGAVRNTSYEYCIFIKRNSSNLLFGDFGGSGLSNWNITITAPDLYTLVIFQYFSSVFNYTFKQTELSRYLVSVEILRASTFYKYQSILSYYYEKYLYINTTQNLTFSLSCSQTLVNQSLILIPTLTSNKFIYSSVLNAASMTKISQFNYSFTFVVPGGSYYILRVMQARNLKNYSLSYFSDSYECPTAVDYEDMYEIYKPCICTSCLAYCSSISNTYGSMVFKDNLLSCSCNPNYYWNSFTQKCQSNCSNFNKDFCAKADCKSISFWSGSTCIQCSIIANNNQSQIILTNNISKCLCLSNFYWNPSSLKCESNCSNFKNISCGTGDCAGISYYSSNSCIQCSLIENTNILVNYSTAGTPKCTCKSNFYWNPTTFKCQSNCSSFNSIFCGQGDCKNISFWNGSTCTQCSLFANNNQGQIFTKNSVSKCVCKVNFYWNPSTGNCESDCLNFNNQNCGKNSFGDCYDAFWNNTACIMCSTLQKTQKKTSSSNNNQCLCITGYTWYNFSCMNNCQNTSNSGCGRNFCFDYVWNGTKCLFNQPTDSSESKGSVNIAASVAAGVAAACVVFVIILLVVNRQKIKNYCRNQYEIPARQDPIASVRVVPHCAVLEPIAMNIRPAAIFPNDDCPICLNSDTDMTLHCSHLYHIACFKRWRIIRPKCTLCNRNDNGLYRRISTECRICYEVLPEAHFMRDLQPLFPCRGLHGRGA